MGFGVPLCDKAIRAVAPVFVAMVWWKALYKQLSGLLAERRAGAALRMTQNKALSFCWCDCCVPLCCIFILVVFSYPLLLRCFA